VTAALASRGLQARNHREVQNLVFEHFVRSGPLDRRLARDLSALQRYREDADYGSDLRFDEETCREELDRARRVLAALESVAVSSRDGEE
jgi:uncharacterized protein (UPF0332 family)